MSYRDRHWMPFFIDDFKVDTLDLECDEIGVYFMMIMLAWARGSGSVPGDMKVLKKMLQRCIADFHGLAFNRIVPKLLARYFEKRDDGQFYQRRVEKELRIARELSEKRSRIARKRWAKNKENNDLGDANAMLYTTHTHTHTQKNTTEDRSSVVALTDKRGKRLPDDWQPSDADVQEAGKIGLRLYEIDNEIAKFCDYWHARAGPGAIKRDWSATWRNWCRKASENGHAKPKQSLVDRGHELAEQARRLENDLADVRREDDPLGGH